MDYLLSQLRAREFDADLSGLEASVSAGIAREQSSGKATADWKLQLAVVCTSVLLGLAVADFRGYLSGPQRMGSELVVLSDDGALAPSVRLGGSM
jgi:hypothetical protein